ncbi:WxL domain-containing protein [Vagococcus xieshaowenii]|nr:WxL domain-containing protein [Vagococcus xieshaowenii]
MKKMIGVALMSTMVLGSLSTTSLAEENEGGTLSRDDNAVNFISGDGPIAPTDPTDPDPDIPVQPMDPEHPGEPDKPTPTSGPLSIDYASKLYFGMNKISTKTANYKAIAQHITLKNAEEGEPTEKDVPSYVQITDQRGSLSGWNLSVTQTDKFKDVSGAPLENAQISISDANIQTKAEDKEGLTYVGSFALTVGKSQPLMSAAEGHGAGTFVYSMGNEESLVSEKDYNKMDENGMPLEGDAIKNKSILLNVPANAKIKATCYTTNLNWVLGNTPANAL